MKASFDLTTTEGKFKVFNAKSGSSISLKNLENGEIIEVNGVLQFEDVNDTYGSPQEVVVTVLYGTDGETYAGISDTVADSGSALIDLFNESGLENIKIAVVKQKSGKGNEFLNIRAIM